MHTSAASLPLEPLPSQRAMVECLKAEDPEVWAWFAAHETSAEEIEAVRLDLLKSTYRIERDTQPQLYALGDEVAARLSLAAPITFYQAQQTELLNAGLAYVPGEIHIVLQGPVLTTLAEPELQAVLGHELSHYLLYESWQREYFTCGQILSALAADAQAQTAHHVSRQRFGLHSEIFCDRGSLLACGDLHTAVAMLVKMQTGLSDVSPNNYLKQADEILSKGPVASQGISHPECYLRARALQLWSESGEAANAEVEQMIEGPLALSALDLVDQKLVTGLSRRLLDAWFSHAWLQTEPALAHARLFFAEYVPPKPLNPTPNDITSPEAAVLKELQGELLAGDEQLQDYYVYVLLDLVTSDRELDEAPLAAAVLLSRQLGLAERFAALAIKELGLRKKQFESTAGQAEQLVAKAAAQSAMNPPEMKTKPAGVRK